jgi:hypothetical protein
MKKTTRVRMLVGTATAAVVLSGAGVGAAFAFGAGETRAEPQPPAVQRGIVTEQSPNPWLANDCTLLREAIPENVPSGC